ncbi:NAD(P)/FAD-dependent oxidoreductase [Ilumatobacter nonamiensis]|uniref:NAD(P)/FAD-dependent oxidoreductase n=1 Tax=Ilumatobacter nonamiensis TaxID=467093 RepID=UPI00034576AF|nr:FAD-dependent oxidoreductase [Ilumatobacter nonamiensis]
MSGNDYDAIIIGAGVIGGAVGFELARRGHRTLNIDKGPGAGYGSTSASSAVIRFSYSTETGVAAAWDGMHYWKNWADYLGVDDENGHARLIQCGMALLIPGEEGHHNRVTPIWDRLGVPYEYWDRDTLATRAPGFDLHLYGPPARPTDDAFWDDAHGEMVGALFSPDAGYVDDPQLAAHNLQRAAEASGGDFRFRTEVVGIVREETDAGVRVGGVELADGSIVSAPVVVNVGGPHSSHINRLAGVYDSMNIKTESIRHETYHVPGPPDIDFTADGFAVADDDSGIYFRPQPNNNILVGTTDPACDPKVPVGPDDDLGELTTDGWETNTLRINKRMPSLGVPLPHEKKGVVDRYDKSDDWIPIYDRTDLDGFYVAIGTSGNQFKNAGVAGHMMAELIEAVEAGHDHDADPLHVTARYTGLDLDLGTFRRNRQINTNSSMTVHG